MENQFRNFIKNEVCLLDGAMGTQIQSLELSDADFGGSEFKMLSDLLTFSKPEELIGIHQRYLKAGANAIETNTFGASELRLSEYDFSTIDVSTFIGLDSDLDLKKNNHKDIAYFMNLKSANLAKEAIVRYQKSDDYDGRPLFVFGSIGPSNWVLTSTNANLRKGSFDQIQDNFYNQVLGLIDGGADVLLFETMQDPLETKAGIFGAKKALKERGVDLPIIAQVTVDAYSKMQIFNTDIVSALTTLQGIGVDVFGINCSIGPDLMEKTVEKLAKNTKVPLSVIPNAGLPVSENGKTVFKFDPQDFANHLKTYIEKFGVRIVGGCCGTTPEFIKAVRQILPSCAVKDFVPSKLNQVSGPQEAHVLDSQSGLIRIAERLNVRGSLKVKAAVEDSKNIDFDVLEDVVTEEVNDLGVPIIDVCMDSNMVNTEEVLVKVIKQVTTDFSGAMCLDSFSVEALLDAVKVYPGRPIINSISLEMYTETLDKIDAVVAPTLGHNPIYIALTTGPKGPGLTAQEKFDLAKEIYEKCKTKYGIKASQLMIDVNAFPIGSESEEGMNFAMESLNAIEMVKTLHPEIMVSMGVGNLTTGLGKKPYMRKLLTSVFVDLARKKGMDAAIINPNHYVPVESLEPADVSLALDVIQNHNMEAFSQLEEIAQRKTGAKVQKKVVYDELCTEDSICQKIKDGYKSKSIGTITNGSFSYEYKDSIVCEVAKALETHQPLDFINNFLMKSMQELGDGFGKGEVSLPHLLKSADVMKHAMGYIESLMRQSTGKSLEDEIQHKGVVILGTVYQDVHSIGKDLVKTLLENYGYKVVDLGVQTPLEKFIEEAKAHNAIAIGMSALLVQTSNHMITVAQMLKEEGLQNLFILIGGAPVNNRHAAYVSLHGQEDPHEMFSNVFYCSSGMDGVNVLNQLLESDDKKQEMLKANLEKLKWHYDNAIRNKEEEEKLLKTLPRRDISVENIHRKKENFLKPKYIQMSMSEFLPHIDRKTLFSLNWRYGGKASWQKKGVNEDILEQKLKDWAKACDENGWLKPQGVIAIKPCYSYGEKVKVLDYDNTEKILGEIHFDTVIGHGKKDVFSAAQYFHPQETGLYDVIGFQLSSGGKEVEDQIQNFKNDGDTESAHFLQGLSDRIAEDMASYLHAKLREHMNANAKQGERYSPGYPCVTNLKVNQSIFEFTKASEHMNVSLTEAFEFDPPGSTGAVVSFHHDAGYE